MTRLVRILAGPVSPAEAAVLADVLKALADPVWLRILSLVADAGEMYGKQLETRIPLAQPTISHHLRVLTRAGLLSTEKVGSHVFYRVTQTTLNAVSAALGRAA